MKRKDLLQYSADGIIRCAYYAFMPNRLGYCGPDQSRNLLEYGALRASDDGLKLILKNFEALYPYLKLIAESNHIRDPFDIRVVESYWIGSDLLNNVSMPRLCTHLLDEQKLRKKMPKKILSHVLNKVSMGAKPHHSFHVLNIVKRTGHIDLYHSISSIDACRIGAGKIKKIAKSYFLVDIQPIVLKNGGLHLGKSIPKKIIRSLDDKTFIKDPRIGDWISVHWGWACEILSKRQVSELKRWTLYNLALANLTI